MDNRLEKLLVGNNSKRTILITGVGQLSLMEIIKAVIIFLTKTDGNFMFSLKESLCR